jgi:SAM-dependent methyltransferase
MSLAPPERLDVASQQYSGATFGPFGERLLERAVYERMREVEDRHWWFTARRHIVHGVIQTLGLPPGAQILEAGCGTGGNLATLCRFGEVTAVETDDDAARIARERKVATVLRGTLPSQMPELGRRFDLIVMLDVLEHIDDEVASLQALRRLLRPGGNLLVTVPAFPLLWSKHDVVHHHKRRYVARTLQSALRRAEWAVRRLTSYNTVLFPVIGLARALEHLRKRNAVVDPLALPGVLANKALTYIFAAERHLVTRFRLPFGVSLLAVAQPQCRL